ncbi:sodium/potassium-transporting ATPase subunit beta-2-like [Anoplophora glabripennis]|uniref:sodium/potassium-transporting ATPase subunit beta-2-like n=1 Tax=Anoplophora glabripennis TaxID=217634 RepID=UPI000874EFDE|nr:sodium/potassium-transporting ATPase subunit beta-2-like [Anoplophora glabripennis]
MTKKQHVNRSQSRALSKQDELLQIQTQYFLKLDETKLSISQRVKRFIWNPDNKQFCGRTGASWSKIGLFYLIFYGMLAALVAICMWVFFQTLDPRIPKWQLDRSIIGTNPGLGFRPMPTNNEESTLIWFQGTNQNNSEIWEHNILQFLDSEYCFGPKVIQEIDAVDCICVVPLCML